MKDYLELRDKHILITGASSGMGRATAILASEYGARVTLIARSEDKLNETVSLMSGEGHMVVPFDVSEIENIEAVVKDIIAKNGPIDGFVHCAGVSKDCPIGSVKYEKINEIMRTNFFSFYEFVRIISKKKNFNENLSIVGISSVLSRCGSKAQSSYCASKAAMNGAVRSMAKELSEKGIRVNSILPASTNTPFLMECPVVKTGMKNVSTTRSYLGISEPSDIANAIVFLLSPASRMITGIELPVDGGWTSG